MPTRAQPSILETEPLGDPDENLFEETTVQRLENLGYRSVGGRKLRDEDTFPETNVVHPPLFGSSFGSSTRFSMTPPWAKPCSGRPIPMQRQHLPAEKNRVA